MPKPSAHQPRASTHDALPSPSSNSSKLPRTTTAAPPKPPSLLRLPSSGYHAIPISAIPPSPGSRLATNPSSPTLTPGSHSSSTSPSGYFSAQPASTKDARSPGSRKPPAFYSGHGIDASRGPPNSLITRGNVHVARRSLSQSSANESPQDKQPTSLVSPGTSGPAQRRRRRSDSSAASSTLRESTGTVRRESSMAPSVDESSEHGSGFRSQSEEPQKGYKSRYTSASENEGEQEDLFIAAAAPSRPNGTDPSTRADRLRSRIAVRHTRQSFPSTSTLTDDSTSTPQKSRLNSVPSFGSGTPQKRTPQFTFSSTSRTQRELREQRDQSPYSPPNPLDITKSRHLDLSPKTSFSSGKNDKDLSPNQFLSQLSIRRPSYPGTTEPPAKRTQTFKPSNLHYSSSRDNPQTPRYDSFQESGTQVDGTESLDSTGPAASVWDELDELKSRIKRIELTGKIPTSSAAAVVANASSNRPRTADTSVTTVSSSPKQVRKVEGSPAGSTAGAQGPHRVHPLLKEALIKVKQHVSPLVYRVLEATACEAIGLAELAGSAGPQGTLHSTSSILSGASLNDRQVRRKADNICRSLTELCIELCDTKNSFASPAVRSSTVSGSRRPSVQPNGDSPSIRASIEPESDVPRSSPSRAMSRIEARRASLHTTKVNGIREHSQEPSTPSSINFSTRLSRAGTALQQRTRRPSDNDEEDDDPTLRAPSRAMTDFRDVRSFSGGHSKRFSRDTRDHSHEPMPELQPSPSLQYTPSIRRPTVSGQRENNILLNRDNSRRFNLNRNNGSNSTPTHERTSSSAAVSEFKSRLAQPNTQYGLSRSSTVTSNDSNVTRSGSFKRRQGGNSAGE